MSRPVGLIVNPLSHAVQRRGSVLEHAATHIDGARLVRIGDFSLLPAQLAELADENVSAVFIEGGDGTLQAVLTSWSGLAQGRGFLPDFAVLPGGSTNLAFKVAGLRQHSADQLPAVVARYRAGQSVTRLAQPALKVESSALPRPQIGMLLSTGSLARAMIYTQNEIHGEGQRGSMAVAQAAARFVLSPEKYLDTDGAPLLRSTPISAQSEAFNVRGDHALSLFTTFSSLSLGLRPFWGAETAPIAFTHAEWPIRRFRGAFLKILAGQTGSGMIQHGLTSYRANAVSVHYEGPVVLDGELLPVPGDGAIKITSTQPIQFLR